VRGDHACLPARTGALWLCPSRMLHGHGGAPAAAAAAEDDATAPADQEMLMLIEREVSGEARRGPGVR